jgi:hypothetical protein
MKTSELVNKERKINMEKGSKEQTQCFTTTIIVVVVSSFNSTDNSRKYTYTITFWQDRLVLKHSLFVSGQTHAQKRSNEITTGERGKIMQ